MGNYKLRFEQEKKEPSSLNRIEHEEWLLKLSNGNLAYLYHYDKYLFPFAYKKNWGIKTIYRPPFVQKFYLDESLRSNEIAEFLTAEYPCGHIQLNADIESTCWQKEKKTNYILSLDHDYHHMLKLCSDHHRRNINKANASNLTFVCSDVWENHYLDFILRHHKPIDNRTHFNAGLIKDFIQSGLEQGKAKLFLVKNAKAELLLLSVFLFDQQRIIYSLAASTKQGYECRAMYFLFSELIKKYTNNHYVLDFEGSNIKGIADFFKGFGAHPEVYYSYSWNHHIICKWLKRLRNTLK